MKRATALLFVVIANIIMLAHAVVPHHHHNALISKACCHPHEGESKENCVLQSSILLPSSFCKQENFLVEDGSKLLHNLVFTSVNGAPYLAAPILCFWLSLEVPAFCFTSVLASTSGLRAPPLV